MSISLEKVANIAQSRINAEYQEALAEAKTLVALGSYKEELVTKLNQVNADLDSEIKSPAPVELLDDTIGAMSEGISLKEYCEFNGKSAWDMSLFTMPKDCDAWKARKKEAKRQKEARNLKHLDQTINFVQSEVAKDNVVVTTNRVKSLKSGGHSFVVAGRIGGEKSEDRLTFKALQEQINKKEQIN